MRNFFARAIVVVILLSISMTSHTENLFSNLKVPYTALNSKAKTQVECLAQNIYFEAGREEYRGQLAVAFVTLRRAENVNYPKSVCGVVRQKTEGTCQFSWWCEDHKREKAIKYRYTYAEKQQYNESRKVALHAYLNWEDMKDPTKGALFYHNTSVNPRWKLIKTVQIGNHIFYRKS
jgi:spore germination cell wall hydrolase CwlJ-like protein